MLGGISGVKAGSNADGTMGAAIDKMSGNAWLCTTAWGGLCRGMVGSNCGWTDSSTSSIASGSITSPLDKGGDTRPVSDDCPKSSWSCSIHWEKLIVDGGSTGASVTSMALATLPSFAFDADASAVPLGPLGQLARRSSAAAMRDVSCRLARLILGNEINHYEGGGGWDGGAGLTKSC